jgi:hypothetical protein
MSIWPKVFLVHRYTRCTPKAINDDLIEIPSELIANNRNIELCIDTLTINNCSFMTTIDCTVRNWTVTTLMDTKYDTYMKHLRSLIFKYKQAGFIVTTIFADSEYSGLDGRLGPIKLNLCNAGDHVPEAERNDQTISERFWVAFHHLPFTAIPKVMTRCLAMYVAMMLNIFPAKGGFQATIVHTSS